MYARLIAASLSGLALVASLGAAAYDPGQKQPSALLSIGSHFGGTADAYRDIPRYGLRFEIDHDRRYGNVPPAPIFLLELSSRGFEQAAMNGLPFARTIRQVNQFGDRTTYTTFDYGLAALGALSLGYVAYEVIDSPSESRVAPPDDGNGEGDAGGPLDQLGDLLGGLLDPGQLGELGDLLDPAQLEDLVALLDPENLPTSPEGLLDIVGDVPVIGDAVGGLLGGVSAGFGRAALHTPTAYERQDRAHILWLDSGTGQMGDLDLRPAQR